VQLIRHRLRTPPDDTYLQTLGARAGFGDRVIGTATLDLELHHAIIIRGNSYRLKDKRNATVVRADVPSETQ
jgi:hypothetical protein